MATPFIDLLYEIQTLAVAGDVAGYRQRLTELARAGRIYETSAWLMTAALTAAATTTQINYTTPGQQGFLVQEIGGSAQFTAFNSETNAFAAVFGGSTTTLPPDYNTKLQVKLGSVRVNGLATNIGGDVPFVDVQQGQPTLLDIHPYYGTPIKLTVPRVVLPGSQVQASLGLIDTSTPVVGANSRYGVYLRGLAILAG